MEQPDAQTITFKLRDDMKFHADGSAVTAEHVAFSWSRFPDLLENQGSQVNASNWGFIESVDAIDSSTVKVNLKAPSASAPVLMATTPFGIVNKAQVLASENNNVQEEDAGAGPYIVTRRDATGVSLARYPDYYKHKNPSNHFVEDGPYIDAQETRVIVDRAAIKAAFLSGDIDYVPTINDRLEFEEFTNLDFAKAAEVGSTEARLLAFDNIKFTDKRAREAISLGIDYEGLIRTVYAGDGIYDGPIGQALKEMALDQKTLKSYRKYDPAEAKKKWEAAGSPLDKIRIECNQDPRSTSLGEFVAQSLKKSLGVETEVLVHDISTWVARAREPEKQWELFVVPYGASPTPESYSMTMMNPNAFAGVSWSFGMDQPNAGLVADAQKVVDLVEAQSAEVDPEARIEKLHELQRFILDDVLVGINMPVPGHSYIVYNKRLQNFPEDDYLLGSLFMRNHDMWIAS
jgi:peptide/nickel transport system substrate-binding protein